MQNRVIIDQTRPDQTRPDHPIVRNSSFELLRIVAMLMIIAHHTNHGGFNFPENSTALNCLWQQFIGMGGSLGNDIFVVLSGYFLINSKGINFHKLLNLWARILFWSLLLYCMSVFSGFNPFDLKEAMKSFMPVTQSQWWFASTYIMLYLIHPYLNRLLHSFTQEEYKHFLKTSVLGWCVISILTMPKFAGAANIITFVCIYSIAGYLRLYGGDLRGKKYLLYGLIIIGINFSPRIIFAVMKVLFSPNQVSLAGLILRRLARVMSSMMSPTTILAVLCMIIGFRSLNITHSKLINTIASATFGVYLIHSSDLYLSKIDQYAYTYPFREIFPVASFQDSPYLIPYIIGVILAVYVSCTVLELLRSKIFRTLTRGYLS